jgi:hypothetical protein
LFQLSIINTYLLFKHKAALPYTSTEIDYLGAPGSVLGQTSEICAVQNGTGAGFFPGVSVFPCQAFLTNVAYLFFPLQRYLILAIDSVFKKGATERMYQKVASHSGKVSRHYCKA